MKILFAVDGSHVTKRMLSYLGAHDELLGPSHELTLLTVVAPVPPHAARFLQAQMIEGYYQDEAQRVLDPIRQFAEQNGWKFRTMAAHGHAAETIAETAQRERFDLIVMGTHGNTSLANVVLGSVATGVVARSKLPVLLIP